MRSTVIIIIISVFVNIADSLRSIQQYGLEDRIPFTSSISPTFPHCVPRSFTAPLNGSQLLVAYSMHNITFTFKNCTRLYLWRADEQVIIQAVKYKDPYIFAVFQRWELPYSGSRNRCVFNYVANIPFNLDGFPLMVLYKVSRAIVVENSYPIKFVFADLLMNFDKYTFNEKDTIKIRCILVFPDMTLLGNITFIGPNKGFIEKRRIRLNSGYILEVEGIVLYDPVPLKFSCILHSLVVSKTITVKPSVLTKAQFFIPYFSINYIPLAICLLFVLIVVVMIGGYTLIIGRKDKLSFDVTAYYQELVEDRTARFTNPIINNLTSPLRKYRLPGLLTAFQLRRNYKRLIDMLVSKYVFIFPPAKPQKQLFEPEQTFIEKAPSYDDKIMRGRILPGKTAISLGPLPREIPEFFRMNQGGTQRGTVVDKIEIDPVKTKRISNESLDPHVIGTLPYTRLFAQKDPYWSMRDTDRPIKIGISTEAPTFQSKETRDTN